MDDCDLDASTLNLIACSIAENLSSQLKTQDVYLILILCRISGRRSAKQITEDFRVRAIDLHRNPLGASGAHAVYFLDVISVQLTYFSSELLKNFPSLDALDITETKLSNKGALVSACIHFGVFNQQKVIAPVLEKQHALVELYLSSNSLSDKGVIALVAALKVVMFA